MKALVFVLVLANLLFFAYAKGYFGRPDNPDAGRVEQQLNPERIRVVARGEPPSVSRNGGKKEAAADKEVAAEKEATAVDKAATAVEKGAAQAEKPAPPAEKPVAVATKPAAGPEVCLTWPDLAAADANRVAGLLGERFADFRVDRSAVPVEGSGWWVYVPPLPSKLDAERKAGELKRMGVTDYFIVQEAGPNRFAISLGVFSSEAAAGEHLATLKAKGVRSARSGPRIGKDALHTLEARGPAARKEAVAAAVRAVLPEDGARVCR